LILVFKKFETNSDGQAFKNGASTLHQINFLLMTLSPNDFIAVTFYPMTFCQNHFCSKDFFLWPGLGDNPGSFHYFSFIYLALPLSHNSSPF
jgi:hypothetical protein